MNKPSTQDDEIILLDLLKVIWSKKISIFLILLISMVISSIYIYQQPNKFKITLEVKKAKNSEFVKLFPLNEILKEYMGNDDRLPQDKIENKNSSLLNYFYYRFIDEVLDYEEFTAVLKESILIKNKLSQVKNDNDVDKKSLLYGFAKSLVVEDNSNINSNSFVFYWHDVNEAKIILNDTLEVAKQNLKMRIINEIDSYLKAKKLSSVTKDQDRIDYLTAQREIAFQLGFKKNVLDINTNILIADENKDANDIDLYHYIYPEHLKGYNAIDIEINYIKNRKYKNFDYIQREIDVLKNTEINFADYNMFLLDVKSMKQTKKIFILSIVIGLIIALFYAFISSNYTSKS